MLSNEEFINDYQQSLWALCNSSFQVSNDEWNNFCYLE